MAALDPRQKAERIVAVFRARRPIDRDPHGDIGTAAASSASSNQATLRVAESEVGCVLFQAHLEPRSAQLLG